jgi:hypothetical protein
MQCDDHAIAVAWGLEVDHAVTALALYAILWIPIGKHIGIVEAWPAIPPCYFSPILEESSIMHPWRGIVP